MEKNEFDKIQEVVEIKYGKVMKRLNMIMQAGRLLCDKSSERGHLKVDCGKKFGSDQAEKAEVEEGREETIEYEIMMEKEERNRELDGEKEKIARRRQGKRKKQRKKGRSMNEVSESVKVLTEGKQIGEGGTTQDDVDK